MPTSSAPGSHGPAGRRDPVRPTPPRRPAGRPQVGRLGAPIGGAARRHRSRSATPPLPTSVWLLATPTARTEGPRRYEMSSGVGNPGAVTETIRRAAVALAPTTGGAHRGPTIVITRHAYGVVTARPGSPTAPDSSPAVPPPGTVSPGAVSDGAVSPGATAAPPPATGASDAHAPDGDLRGGEAGVGLLLLDATRGAGASVDVGHLAGFLAPGGVLAVLTTSDHAGGRLRDPRPALIASARGAGLDYWQHIVTTSPASREHQGNGDGAPDRRSWCLVADISVFRRPSVADRIEQPGPGTAPDITTDGVQR